MKKLGLLLIVVLLWGALETVVADPLEDLSDLAENSGQQIISEKSVTEDQEPLDELEGLSDGSGNNSESSGGHDALNALSDMDGGESANDNDELEEVSADAEEAAAETSYTVGGYVKPLAYWSRTMFADDLWEVYEELASDGDPAPENQDDEEFTDVGARVQVKLEGFLGETARLFTVLNVDYNEAEEEESSTITRVIEAYVEMYEGSRTWKVGSQLITWGFMEGIEVPTDRINARDASYASTEYEDTKMASTGVLLKQAMGDFDTFEILYIPRGKVQIDPDYADYLFTQSDLLPDTSHEWNKWAVRYFRSSGNLDLALSYLEGLDAQADAFINEDDKIRRIYHRTKSPGLDLQYNFGSALAKLAYVFHQTEDEEGDDPFIKNSWHKYLAGAEFKISSATINIYAGQMLVDDFNESSSNHQKTNGLMGQAYERTDFVSGHVTANFLTGDALGLTMLFASYRSDEGKAIRHILTPTFTYKLADGLETVFNPSYVEFEKTKIHSLQAEVKYSF